MRSTRQRHEESSHYSLALRIHRETVEIARTESRIISDGLQRHALRLLEHVAASVGMTASRSRARSIDYARLALIKLAAVLDAASCDQDVSEQQRTRTLTAVRQLESELNGGLHDPARNPLRREHSANTPENRLGRQRQRAPKSNYATVHELAEIERAKDAELQDIAEQPVVERSAPTGTS